MGFELKISEDDEDVGYLRLPSHPGGDFRIAQSIRVSDIIGRPVGPDVVLDFDGRGFLVGIEIVG